MRCGSVAVDGVPLPVPVPSTGTVTFDGWSILRHCAKGKSDLLFEATRPDGQIVAASSSLVLDIELKGKK